MSVITKGRIFANGEQLTAEKLNVLVDEASFNKSTAVDNATTRVSASGAITVKPQGITSTELAADAVTSTKIATNAVTTAKIADSNVTFAKLTDVIDDDTMATASDTTLATSESIKAYVDSATNFTPSTYSGGESVTLPNGLIMKFGISTLTSSGGQITFETPFPVAVVNVQGNLHGGDASGNLGVTAYDKNSITVNPAVGGTYHWQAIGY